MEEAYGTFQGPGISWFVWGEDPVGRAADHAREPGGPGLVGLNAKLRGLTGDPQAVGVTDGSGEKERLRPGEVRWERPAKTQPRARPLESCTVDSEPEGVRLKLGRRVRSAYLQGPKTQSLCFQPALPLGVALWAC